MSCTHNRHILRNPHRHILVLFAVLSLALSTATLVQPASVFAEDAAGNLMSTDSTFTGKTVDTDFYWAGQSLTASDSKIGADILAAAMNIDITDTEVNGSVRTASQTLNITRVNTTGNITSAAQYITIGKGTAAGAVYAVAQDIHMNGSSSCAGLYGQTVTINGTIEGDVTVVAQKLVFGKHAHVTGTVHATVGVEPVQKEGSRIGKLKVVYSEPLKPAEEDRVSTLIGTLIDTIITMAENALVATLLILIFPRVVDGAYRGLRSKPGFMALSGLMVLITFVPVSIILLLSVVISDLGGTLLAGVIASAFIAAPLMGAVLGRFILPQGHPTTAAAAGGALVGLAVSLPYIGLLFDIAAIVLFLGYLLLCIISARKQTPALQS